MSQIKPFTAFWNNGDCIKNGYSRGITSGWTTACGMVSFVKRNHKWVLKFAKDSWYLEQKLGWSVFEFNSLSEAKEAAKFYVHMLDIEIPNWHLYKRGYAQYFVKDTPIYIEGATKFWQIKIVSPDNIVIPDDEVNLKLSRWWFREFFQSEPPFKTRKAALASFWEKFEQYKDNGLCTWAI